MTSVLAALRAVPAPDAIRDVERIVRARARGDDDVVQETMIRVVRKARDLHAESEGEARSWLRRVLATARLDLRRAEARQRHRVRRAMLMDASTHGDCVDTMAAEAETSLRSFVDDLLARVTDRRASSRRQRNARLAIARHVYGHEPRELPWSGSRAALYKAIQRGRDEVLLPLLARDERPIARRVEEQLLASRRRDHSQVPEEPIVGRRYGGWTVQELVGRHPRYAYVRVRAVCRCGREAERWLHSLRRNRFGCVGCARSRKLREAAGDERETG